MGHMALNINKLINIDVYSSTPKYLQLVNSILRALEEGKLQKDSVLPSINELSYEFDISRDTAEKAYKQLKHIGILGSVPGKGYFIKSSETRQRYKILLMFNKLSAHKKIIYDAFTLALKDSAAIDLYVYNNDYNLFKKMIEKRATDYTHYVIIPHFFEGGENIHEIINTIPSERLLLLDKTIPGLVGNYAAVFENFENDIFSALEKIQKELRKYHTLKLIFPAYSYYPEEIKTGFIKFCKELNFNYKVVNSISDEEIYAGEVYINVMEDDLVTLIERIISLKLKVGKDIGVISYNETPLKKIILNGITTISTDFQKMGEMAADLILQNSKARLEVPFILNLRPSL
jgi:DNA-binding transcriptional regulator YhcF (GntR family)